MRRRVLFALGLSAALALLSANRLEAQVDVIRGRVTSAGADGGGAPIANVSVTATSLNGNVNRNAKTDKDGRYTVTFPEAEGDYFVTFVALGYSPRRIEVKRTADQDILLGDARLTPIGAVLDTVVTTGQRNRNRPVRGATAPDISGTEKSITSGLVPPDLAGDLAAMAATLPGVLFIQGVNGDPSGISVLGLDQDQNNTSLNGLNSNATDIPRDANVSVNLATSPYDVSQGQFSGGRTNIRTSPGSNYINRGSSVVFNAPQLEWTDRAGRALGQQYTNANVGGAVSGPFALDKAFYSTRVPGGATGERPPHPAQHRLARPRGRRHRGGLARSPALDPERRSSPGDRARFPERPAQRPGARIGQSRPHAAVVHQRPGVQPHVPGSVEPVVARVTARDDAARCQFQFDHMAGRGAGSSQRVLRLRRSERDRARLQRVEALPHAISRFVERQRDRELHVPGRHERCAVDRLRRHVGEHEHDEQLGGPHESAVVVQREQQAPREGDERGAARRLLAGPGDERVRHLHLQLAVGSRGGSAGVVHAPTDADSRERRRMDRRVLARRFLPAATPISRSSYGARVDANRYEHVPTLNSELLSLFDVRNDHLPNGVYVSPRVGFSWTYGTAPQIGAFEGAARLPRAVVRGGIGIFQNSLSASLPSQAFVEFGSAGRTATGDVRRRRDADSGLARVRHRSVSDPQRVPRRAGRHAVRQLRLERDAVRAELRVAAKPPVDVAVGRRGARQPFVGDGHRRPTRET